jgi:hypothetical protein
VCVYGNDRDVSSILPVGVGYGKKMHVGITPHPHPVRGKGESRNECGIAVILCVGCFAAILVRLLLLLLLVE